MTDRKLHALIEGCRRQENGSQRELYFLMRNYGLTITNRYANSLEEAEEIAQDGFVKVFKSINAFENKEHFKSWFRKIFVNVAIDYYRKYKLNKKSNMLVPIHKIQKNTITNQGMENLEYADLLSLVRELPPAYRLNFILFSIEGYKHSEISKQLGIAVGTSKSNTAKARGLLRNKLIENQKLNQYG